MSRLEIGSPAPAFTLPTAGGDAVSLSDYLGRKVIVYFYPKASTPGCTTQACDFRDSLESLSAHGYSVLGVSPDSAEALEKFIRTQNLTFPLLSDEDHAVAERYRGMGREKELRQDLHRSDSFNHRG